MFNQCVVLLVSYFASAVEDLFVACLSEKFNNLKDAIADKDKDIKIPLGELLESGFSLDNESVAKLLVRKKEISFQDMQSIKREVEAYFKFQPEKNEDTNNIILAQHCRHALVHYGGKANSKTIAQIKDARPRTVKQSITNGEEVNFTEDAQPVCKITLMPSLWA
jgi:hypothetical protein